MKVKPEEQDAIIALFEGYHSEMKKIDDIAEEAKKKLREQFVSDIAYKTYGTVPVETLLESYKDIGDMLRQEYGFPSQFNPIQDVDDDKEEYYDPSLKYVKEFHPENPTNGIGELVQFVRKEKRITQKELSEKLVMVQAAVSRIEQGGAALRFDTVIRLCKAMGVQVGLVVGDYCLHL